MLSSCRASISLVISNQGVVSVTIFETLRSDDRNRSRHSRPQSSTVFLNCVSCSSGNEISLNFLIGRLKMNAQLGTTFYPSTHNVSLPVEFQLLARVYYPVEICRLTNNFNVSMQSGMWLEATDYK